MKGCYFNCLCFLNMAQAFRSDSVWLRHKWFWKVKTAFARRKQNISGLFLGQAHKLLWDHGMSTLMAHTDEWFLGGNGFLCRVSRSFCIVESIVRGSETRAVMQTGDLFSQAFCKSGQVPSIDLQLVNVFRACFALMFVRKRSLGWGWTCREEHVLLNENSCCRACHHSFRNILLLQKLWNIFSLYVWWGILKTFEVNSNKNICK